MPVQTVHPFLGKRNKFSANGVIPTQIHATIKMKNPRKPQVTKNIPKWVAPEKRMRRYRKNASDSSKIPFVKFRIVVPTEEDRKQIQAALEYFHDNRHIDTDFIPVNQLAHAYLDKEREPKYISPIIVDSDQFHHLEQATCPHPETYIQGGIKYCKECWKALEVTSHRD